MKDICLWNFKKKGKLKKGTEIIYGLVLQIKYFKQII